MMTELQKRFILSFSEKEMTYLVNLLDECKDKGIRIDGNYIDETFYKTINDFYVNA